MSHGNHPSRTAARRLAAGAALALLVACTEAPVQSVSDRIPELAQAAHDDGQASPAPTSTTTASRDDRAGPPESTAQPAPTTTPPPPPPPSVATPSSDAAALARELEPLNVEDGALFEPDTTGLSDANRELLGRAAELMARYPSVAVEVAGHTDTNGDAETNRRLSQERADAAVAFLVEAGIDPDRLVAVGYGQDRPRASNDTIEGRALNRRMELSVVGVGAVSGGSPAG